jgi:HK97 gp10 family phage protein
LSLLQIRPKSRRPRKKHERRQKLPQLIAPEGVRAIRHALHTYHHIQHFAEHRHIRAMTVAGEPLSITISATINVEDLEEISPEQLEALEADIHEILQDTGQSIVTSAKSEVPVRTGKLRDSINFMALDAALAVNVFASTGYAKFVEYGTSKMDAEPFLIQPALDAQYEMSEKINDAIENRLNGQVQSQDGSPTVNLEIADESEAVTGGEEALSELGEFVGLTGL